MTIEGVNKIFKTHSDNFVVQCLRCNTPTPDDREEDDIYCQECASPLVNKCTKDDTQGYGNYEPCGITLKPESVYCKKCASISLFADKGLLENKYPEVEVVTPQPQTHDVPF